MIAATVEQFGSIDILVKQPAAPAYKATVAEFRDILELNVLGTFIPYKLAVSRLVGRGGGNINLAGTSDLRRYANRVGHSPSRWAIRSLRRTVALDLGGHGITVNDRSERHQRSANGQNHSEKPPKSNHTPEEVYNRFARETVLDRAIKAADVAAAVVLLGLAGAA